jgi:pyrimidine-nucleoside phosphorylase
MRVYEIIAKKRDGGDLSPEEIEFIVSGYVQGLIPDYQMSALLMAVYLKGMSYMEVIHLTKAMVNTGQTLDLSGISGITVDKHSTGGVGDKVSLVVAPLVAAAGVPVPMLSGRGLGHTGGTLDKLESIPGFRTSLEPHEFLRNVSQVGISIMGQSEQIAPADGKLYALRDVTATVSSLPLIASSIMSKKLAAGPQALVFDVKVGRGAVLSEARMAQELAQLLNRVSQALGLRTVALLTDMDQPLGWSVGNALEVAEALACLRGEGPKDVLQVSMALGERMLILGGLAGEPSEARRKLEAVLSSGEGLEKFRAMVLQQGGDPRVVDDPRLLPKAKVALEVKSPADGYVRAIDAKLVGQACVQLGAGKATMDDRVDPSVGVRFVKKVGDAVNGEELVASVLANHEDRGQAAVETVLRALSISEHPPSPRPLVLDLLEPEEGGREVDF